MTLFKTKKDIDIDKSIGNMRITSHRYGEYVNHEHRDWVEVHCWYDCDCENCPMGWESRSYEGECDDCGCLFGYEIGSAPIWKCMLPRWFKNLILKLKGE